MPTPYAAGATTAWNSSWRHFYERFAQAIVAYAQRAGLNGHSAEDVLQEVMVALLRHQPGQPGGYDPERGPFQAWLWGIIRNRVRSHRRKDNKETVASPIRGTDSQSERGPVLPEVPQAPTALEQQEKTLWQEALLMAALRKVQERTTPENFAIYTALLQEQATPEELSRTYGKTPNAIYAAKHRCEQMVLAEAQALRSAWEKLG